MKRLISIVVSLGILAIIYSKIDFQGLIGVFQNCDRLWMAISLGMVVPLTLMTSWRLQQLMPRPGLLSFWEANKLTLAASVLNMVLPSKMGDIAKAYFIRDRGYLNGSLSLSLVVFEKSCDMLSLLLWCVFGLAIYSKQDILFWVMAAGVLVGLILGLLLLGSKKFADFFFKSAKKIAPKKPKKKLEKLHISWGEMHDYFWRDKQQLTQIALTSIFIWFLHLLQIWFFIFALNASVPFVANLALSPLAILAGLLPLTFAGVGTRDAALILFYQPFFNAQTGAALGLLCTSRYFLPAVGGLPFFGQYLANVRGTVKS
ncbi:lysylphosphatidylglycerol synthase transmembrane domain-containing protein [Baaleninema sp.]|uniref:lysylphosphatidylglycerol synthase transmembrane domain-containing protein n=1 Tax=Baaleninema sp. TaxID=3101197 RepID=UPI003CFE70B7